MGTNDTGHPWLNEDLFEQRRHHRRVLASIRGPEREDMADAVAKMPVPVLDAPMLEWTLRSEINLMLAEHPVDSAGHVRLSVLHGYLNTRAFGDTGSVEAGRLGDRLRERDDAVGDPEMQLVESPEERDLLFAMLLAEHLADDTGASVG